MKNDFANMYSENYQMFTKKIRVTIKPSALVAPVASVVPVVPDVSVAPVVSVVPLVSEIPIKKCNFCGLSEPEVTFYGGNKTKCKECIKTEQKVRNAQYRQQDLALQANPTKRDELFHCRGTCGQDRPASMFRTGHGRVCLECERAYGREYNQTHPEVRRKWQEENAEHFTQLKANWYQKNKSHIQAKYNSRYHDDKEFKIKEDMKRQLQREISKISTTDDYIGSNFESIAMWLEYNFSGEMTWQTHGTVWDVDHVIPVSRWDLTNPEEFEMCFDWKNLSPLECEFNRVTKRANLDLEQIGHHKEMLQQYYAENELEMDELTEYIDRYNHKLISLGETP